jgi:hypothetical protein
MWNKYKQNLHQSSPKTNETIRSKTKDYDSLVNAPAFLQDTGIVGSFLPFYIIIRRQAGLGTEHLKNDIRKYRYPGKRTRPDTTRRKPLFRRTYQREKAVSVPQTFHFLHPAARASGRLFRCRGGKLRRANAGFVVSKPLNGTVDAGTERSSVSVAKRTRNK